ncbi:MAG: hypothetical protein ABSH19_07630 [Opitutales bacterium]
MKDTAAAEEAEEDRAAGAGGNVDEAMVVIAHGRMHFLADVEVAKLAAGVEVRAE